MTTERPNAVLANVSDVDRTCRRRGLLPDGTGAWSDGSVVVSSCLASLGIVTVFRASGSGLVVTKRIVGGASRRSLSAAIRSAQGGS